MNKHVGYQILETVLVAIVPELGDEEGVKGLLERRGVVV